MTFNEGFGFDSRELYVVNMEDFEMLRDLRDLEYLRSFRREKTYGERLNPFDVYEDGQFFTKYRFSKSNMLQIINKFKAEFKNDPRGGSVPVPIQIMAAVRYWGRNEIQDDAADMHGFTQQTLSNICSRVASAIAGNSQYYIKMPTTVAEQSSVIEKFKQIRGLRQVIGAIDCTHIRIPKVGGALGLAYINRKGFYSINTQVVCDADLRIRDIVAHWRGSAHDARIFRESSIKVSFEEGNFRGRLLGDSGYPCTPYLFTPILHPNSPAEEQYNECHIATRNVVERCFGVWKQRFRILLTGMRGSLQNIKKTIVALAVLHNLAIDFKDILNENAHYEADEEEIINNEPENNYSRTEFIRNYFN